MQVNTTENPTVSARAYYRSLRKGERSRLLTYLTVRFGYKPKTMCYKLAQDDALLRRDEAENVMQAIESGVWRQ